MSTSVFLCLVTHTTLATVFVCGSSAFPSVLLN